MTFLLTAVLVVNLPLVVRTYDSAGVSARVLERAQQGAGVTLAAVGIEPIWRPPCHATGCVSKPKPREVIVRLVKSTPRSERDSLGFAAVDVGQRAGTLATLYVDRVDALAAQSGVDRGELLGRAIAHEIGHLILGTADHPRFGLMRAIWKADELSRDMPLDWIFSEDQGAKMRRRLAARASETPVVESVIAEARLSTESDDPVDNAAMWKRARRLEPSTRVTVTVSGAAPVERYFVRLDSAELVVLNLSAPGLPKRQLLNMAVDNPAWMAATAKMIYKDNNLRVGPEGVFVKDRKIAELTDVVEHLPRATVASIVK